MYSRTQSDDCIVADTHKYQNRKTSGKYILIFRIGLVLQMDTPRADVTVTG